MGLRITASISWPRIICEVCGLIQSVNPINLGYDRNWALMLKSPSGTREESETQCHRSRERWRRDTHQQKCADTRGLEARQSRCQAENADGKVMNRGWMQATRVSWPAGRSNARSKRRCGRCTERELVTYTLKLVQTMMSPKEHLSLKILSLNISLGQAKV